MAKPSDKEIEIIKVLSLDEPYRSREGRRLFPHVYAAIQVLLKRETKGTKENMFLDIRRLNDEVVTLAKVVKEHEEHIKELKQTTKPATGKEK